MRRVFLFLILFTALCFPDCPHAEEGARLLKIVALSRHGVRSPTQDHKTLKAWSTKTWPVWPVKKGELTPRGFELVKAMWENLAADLKETGLLPERQCPPPGSIYVRADVDERTRATAQAIIAGIAPDCSIGYAASSDKIDPLFHPVKSGLYKFNPVAAATDVLTMTNGGLEKLQEDFSGAMALINRISGPPAAEICSRFMLMPNCRISDLPNAISVSPDGENVRLVGGLSIASSLAEIFLLEYGEWPGVAAGWGQVDAATLSQIMPVHAKIFDVINRAPIVAWARGSSLLTEMTAALFGEHADKRANDARLVVFVGHDTNLANIGALLGITWHASGYPLNGIPPASVLFLELWEKNGHKYILFNFYAQSPQALHAPFGPGANGSRSKSGSLPESIQIHAPKAGTVTFPPVVGQARFSEVELRELVKNVTKGAPIAPQEQPAFDFAASPAK